MVFFCEKMQIPEFFVPGEGWSLVPLMLSFLCQSKQIVITLDDKNKTIPKENHAPEALTLLQA